MREHPHERQLAEVQDAWGSAQARARPLIMPAMTRAECLQITKIYKIAARISPGPPMVQRPFRAPHHTTSHAGRVGGGWWLRPGAVSLGHPHVVLLDDLPEFGQSALDDVFQPILMV